MINLVPKLPNVSTISPLEAFEQQLTFHCTDSDTLVFFSGGGNATLLSDEGAFIAKDYNEFLWHLGQWGVLAPSIVKLVDGVDINISYVPE